MKRLFRLLARPFTPRGFKTLLFSTACLATLIAAFYVIENWRGEKAWAHKKAELQTKGIPITYDEVLPTPPPDDQNFIMAPFWVERWSVESSNYEKITTKMAEDLYRQAVGMNLEAWRKSKNYEMPPHPTSFLGDWQAQRLPNLEALRDYFVKVEYLPASAVNENAAAAIWGMTEAWSDEISVLTEADRTRPASYLSVDWRKGYFGSNPLWTVGFRMSKNLLLRAQCALELGNEQEALRCFRLINRVAEVQLAPPSSLVGVLVSSSQEYTLLAGIWHGLARHQWSEASLQQMDAMLAQRDYPAAWQRAMRLEQVTFVQTLEDICSSDNDGSHDVWRFFNSYELKEKLENLGFRAEMYRFFPRGWWRQNQVTYSQLQEPLLQKALPWSELVQINDEERIRKLPGNPYTAFAKVVAPTFQSAKMSTVSATASIGLARLAIAAERHRLRTGKYPESLDALKEYFPQGLPMDPFVDKPFGYELVNGIPKFWSVGWNLQDDGGTVVKQGKIPARERTDRTKGDIVWTYPDSTGENESR